MRKHDGKVYMSAFDENLGAMSMSAMVSECVCPANICALLCRDRFSSIWGGDSSDCGYLDLQPIYGITNGNTYNHCEIINIIIFSIYSIHIRPLVHLINKDAIAISPERKYNSITLTAYTS